MRARLEQIKNRFEGVGKSIQSRFGGRSETQGGGRQIVAVLLVLLVIAFAVLYLVGAANATGSLVSSGTIEATEIRIGPEIGGLVKEVLVDEGDTVEEGQPLLRLDDALLQNQRDLAVAGVVQAMAGVQSAITALESAQQAYDALFDNLDLTTAAALQELANARDAVRDAENREYNLSHPGKQTDIDSARADLVLKRDALDKAQDSYEDYASRPEDNLRRASLQLRLSAAQAAYDDAVRDLNDLVAGSNNIDLAIAQAEREVANARLAHAQADYDELASGPGADQLTLAQDQLSAAQAQLSAAQANQEAAQTALDSADLQIARAQVNAPVAGTVLYRNIQPGEIVSPGATVLVLARLDEMTITVYLPEDRYGQVNLGDTAEVTVDSFPGVKFNAAVTRIADQAEFTPRNVQTGEGRRTTVFAIELKLYDPQGKLKPGMPADVTFVH